MKWYSKAAEQSDADGQAFLGMMYVIGKGVPKDYVLAHMWFLLAKAQGNETALQLAAKGLNLIKPRMTPSQIAKAKGLTAEWYRKAAEQGDAVAQFNLGFMAEQGDAVAQYNLGFMYANRDGDPKNRADAIKWFYKAAEQGNADAQYNLGAIYLGGAGVPKDRAEASKWFRKAAEQGHKYAKWFLEKLPGWDDP